MSKRTYLVYLCDIKENASISDHINLNFTRKDHFRMCLIFVHYIFQHHMDTLWMESPNRMSLFAYFRISKSPPKLADQCCQLCPLLQLYHNRVLNLAIRWEGAVKTLKCYFSHFLTFFLSYQIISGWRKPRENCFNMI